MVVLTVRARSDDLIVTVAPITHRPPRAASRAVELPAATRRRLGLDAARSWIVTDDLNRFVWPGPDLRPIPGRPASFAYGLIPAALYEQVRLAVLDHAREGRVRRIDRME